MTITEFLVARIAEDEFAIANRPKLSDPYDVGIPFLNEAMVERLQAECAAKRTILEMHGAVKDDGWISGAAHGNLWCGMCGSLDDSPEPFPCDTYKALAGIYATHPDYQKEWAN